MKYPALVKPRLCRTDIRISLEQEGISVYGEPLQPFEWAGKCNYQDSAKTVQTADKKVVQLNGRALIPGDICPGMGALSGGTAWILGGKRRIVEARKARNPDGTVNYTEVLLA